MTKGTLKKIKGKLNEQNQVLYWMPIGEQEVYLNDLVGQEITLNFTGNIYCIDTGKKISKSYNNGFCYESYITRAACDICIMQPEKCHFHLGTCREPVWGENHCFIPHIVYLANTSNLKVGITRGTQVPTRWIDQGASEAIKLLEVPNRYAAGLIEVKLKEKFSDKTNWKKMLESEGQSMDLESLRSELQKVFLEEFKEYNAIWCESEKQIINFPLEHRPRSFKSTNFDKVDVVSGVLKAIKGQYLFINDEVINIRRHQGYEIEFLY
jgi:hypothetical protein